MSLACNCDICGKIMSLDKNDKHVRSVMFGSYTYRDYEQKPETHFDLCDECYKNFYNMMIDFKRDAKERLLAPKAKDTVSETEDTV